MKVVSTSPKAYYIEGKSTDKYRWTFNIPDSISQNIWSLQFFSRSNKEKQRINFASVLNNDTLTCWVNNFENDSDKLIINGVFLKNDPNQGDVLKVDIKEKSYLMECMKYPGFAFFYDPYNKKKYENFIEDYKLKISANPNSVYYISNLSAAVAHFHSTSDIIELFDLFSPSLQSSDHGKRICDYINLNPVFENIKLPLANDEKKQEALIQDFTKYNLLELTASWCVWCQKIIPTLNEISKQYNARLIITYVTIDNEKGLVDFRKHIKKQNITWRALWLNKKDGFLNRKAANGIPCGILVNKEGKIVDYFNFNIPKDLERFHKILQGN
jgi:thiol-disulfide isomerase/thioredoxin